MPVGNKVKHKLAFAFPWGLMAGSEGFGGRVLQARLSLGAKRGRAVTQKEVAEWLGVRQGTVGRWEKAIKEPDLATIERLAQVLEVSAAWLAFGSGVPRPDHYNVPRGETTASVSPDVPTTEPAAVRERAGGEG